MESTAQNTELTWTNNSWPQLTGCFQNTTLQWVPCGFLLTAAPFYMVYLMNLPRCVKPIKPLYFLKQIFSAALILLFVIDFFHSICQSNEFIDVTLMPVVWTTTMLVHVALVNLEHCHDLVRTYLLFVFWILGSTTTLVQFISALRLQTYEWNTFHFINLTLRYVVTCVMFCLSCLANYDGTKPKAHNPMLSASILSVLSFFWMERFVFKGFKTAVQYEDIFEMFPQDRSDIVVKDFLTEWDKVSNSYKRSTTHRRGKALEERIMLIVSISRLHDLTFSVFSLKLKINKSSASKRKRKSLFGEKSSLLQQQLQEDSSRSLHRSTLQSDCDFLISRQSQKMMKENKNPNRKPSLWTALFRTYWLQTLKSHSGQLVFFAMTTFYPMILGWFIDYVSNGEFAWHGYIFALALIMTKILNTVFSISSQFSLGRMAVRVQSATIGAVFKKTLKISNEARKETTAGEIVNLMSVDAGHFKTLVTYSHLLWLGLAFFITGIYLTYTVVGFAMLAGFGFMAAMMILNVFIARKMKHFQNEMMVIKDERVKLMNEILNGIKAIKLYGWEPMFMEKVLAIREKELKILWKISLAAIIVTFFRTGAMFWMNFLTFVTYVLVNDNHQLDASTTFVAYNYIAMVRLGVNRYPKTVRELIKTLTSVERVCKFLNSDDLNPISLERDTSDSLAAKIDQADFSWEKKGIVTLRGINLEVIPGQLIAVVGPVGCGKSSLLSALLGEMHIRRGNANLNSSVAYVSQQAWIQNETIKQNILFGRDFHQQVYENTIKACALGPDLDLMPAADETEIGEKGINLSGGQKQRVCLARAVYSGANIYLLDDPLSAVDGHVGRHIFNHVVGKNGCLKNKTRILVTHGIHWLPHVDQIIVMSGGQILETGTYEELVAHQGPFADFMSQYFMQQQNPDDSVFLEDRRELSDNFKVLISWTSGKNLNPETEAKSYENLFTKERSYDSEKSHEDVSFSTSQGKTPCSKPKKFNLLHNQQKRFPHNQDFGNESRLTTDERATGGKVMWKMYLVLAKRIGSLQTVFIAFMLLTYQVSFHRANIWLTEWNDDLKLANFSSHPANSSQRQNLNSYYIAIYGAIGAVQTCSVLAYACMLYISNVAASRKLHMELLNSVMHAPMYFFDTTPIGRILNRFSQDIETLDNDVFEGLDAVCDNGLKVFGVFMTLSFTMPEFIGVCIPVLAIIHVIQRLYVGTACQLRRLASNNRSPVFAHFSEILSGVHIIRAYRAQERLIAQSHARVDKLQTCVTASNALARWLQTRLDITVYVVIIAVTIFAIVLRDNLSPGIIGLTITYALRVSTNLSKAVREYGELEMQVISVERILEYSELESEAPWNLQDMEDYRINQHWPQLGQIRFSNFSTKYREGQRLVLRDINCEIKGGEKIGIVGRTGAGKSSMVLSLFRLLEATSGLITIDGVDIATIGLHTLRHRLAILPQDPVMFAGSLRMNLDPFDEKADYELWNALEHSHLKYFVHNLENKLDHEIAEGGKNLSVGQCQLVCLARTLLKRPKILVLDEATAAVDMETDALIQETIRREFRACTILTIAHRLNTIMDSDRLMVLQMGKILELDSPSNLLGNPGSVFFSMAKEAGLIAVEKER